MWRYPLPAQLAADDGRARPTSASARRIDAWDRQSMAMPQRIPAIAHLRDSYRVPEILTLGRFPDARESDSTWRTQEVRHVGSDTIAPRFWCVPAAWFGEEDERRPSGPSASGARRNL